MISKVISSHRESRRSATLIARWWRKQLDRPNVSRSGRSSAGLRAAMDKVMLSDQSTGFERRATANIAGLHAAADKVMLNEQSNMAKRRATANVSGLHDAADKVMPTEILRGGKFNTASTGHITMNESKDYDDLLDQKSGTEEHPYEDQEFQSRPEHIRRLGKAAYQAMLDPDNDGEICIVEKSYVMTGTKLQDQSLFFYALQNLIDMEREANESESGSHTSFDPQIRQKVLSVLQSKLSLTSQQRRFSYPRSKVAHANNTQNRFVMDLSIMGFKKMSLPLPLPEVSGQYGLACLLLRIKDSGLIILLKLLLLERSVLVIGERPEEVTACATAFLELLDPYKWASAFMPLLPLEMLDFVSSPVPFIAGMIVEDKKHMRSILKYPGVKEAISQGLSVVNLVSGRLIVTREKGTADMLRMSYQMVPELKLYQKRLEEYCKLPSSNLRSFKSFFKHGASLRESLTMQKIKNVIKKHMSQFTAQLVETPDSWEHCGEFNKASGMFEYSPDKYIQPLKDRMIFQVQFQEMMAHTQLFVGFVEELQSAREKRNNLMSGLAAKFIATWVEYHWNAKHSS